MYKLVYCLSEANVQSPETANVISNGLEDESFRLAMLDNEDVRSLLKVEESSMDDCIVYEEEANDEPVVVKEEVSTLMPMAHTLCFTSESETNANGAYKCVECNQEYESIDEFALHHDQQDFANVICEGQTQSDDKLFELKEEFIVEEEEEESAEDIDTIEVLSLNQNDESLPNNSAEDEDAVEIVWTADDVSQQEYSYATAFETFNENPNMLDEYNSRFQCDICYKYLATEEMREQHKQWHERMSRKDQPPAKVFCEICQTAFDSTKNLKLHRKMHQAKPLRGIEEALPIGASIRSLENNHFYCEICEKSFEAHLLEVHQNMHQQGIKHVCKICNKVFESAPALDLHAQVHAANPNNTHSPKQQALTHAQKKHVCRYCGSSFARPHEKVKHERVHTGEKPYGCEVCGKAFRVSYSLTLHLRTHTDVRPFVCQICFKSFKSQNVYVHHLSTHDTERRFKCNLCSKTFRTSVQLCGHRKSHEKPFSCPECSRPFSTHYGVKMHIKTHAQTTDKGDSSVGTANNALLKHSCPECGAVYARSHALRSHMLKQHNLSLLSMQEAKERHQENSADDETKTAVDALNIIKQEEATKQQQILEGEEIIEDFSAEEIVTDWGLD